MPSVINELMLSEIKGAVGTAQSLIVVDSSRLKSGESLTLRKNLRGCGATLKVAKVAILKLAIPSAVSKLCDGKCPVGVVIAPDMVAAAKILSDLTKEDRISIKGGLMDGLPLDPNGIKKLASLPGKDTLRGMLVNVLAAPIVGFARVIAEIHKKLNPEGAAATEGAAASDGAAAPESTPAP